MCKDDLSCLTCFTSFSSNYFPESSSLNGNKQRMWQLESDCCAWLLSKWPLYSSKEEIHPSLNKLPSSAYCVFYLHTSCWHKEAFNHVHFLFPQFKTLRNFQLTCARARCTSPTEARERAGTRCPASLAQMAAEELPGGGDGSFLNFCALRAPPCRSQLIKLTSEENVLLFNVSYFCSLLC